MKLFKAEAFIDGKSCGFREDKKSMANARSLALYDIYHAIHKRYDTFTHEMKEGEVQTVSAEVTVEIKLVQTCLVNRRAPARPREIVQKEKADRAARLAEEAQKAKERQQRWEQTQLAQQALLRRRVQNQIDHAFKTGVSGSEPAAKYITCESYNCNAPAAILILSQPIQKGATALDENTIVGVRCDDHNGRGGLSVNAMDIVKCAQLEFFYDGVRQITITEGQQ